ncbi:hypothetical protein AbraIFM66951_010647 [Aspergillus brasiliensis]|uniref:Uncharacterized protein n=1 Tax=Aspergillus brasiliensis TaxID=319629 RepID=A0A9W5YFB8_9EURO|nr:hypothetical protein AbraCBS73388_005916 [Aspergillus brasiliensis]GKZ47291.1 hypothetical protein AbraIFM66951_010647 [Aspergillus brasiliensis]
MVKPPSRDLAIGVVLTRGKLVNEGPVSRLDRVIGSVIPSVHPWMSSERTPRIGENMTASEIRELGLSYGRRMLIGSGGPSQDSCVRESRVGDHSRLVTKGSMNGARNIKRTFEVDDASRTVGVD